MNKFNLEKKIIIQGEYYDTDIWKWWAAFDKKKWRKNYKIILKNIDNKKRKIK